MESQRTLLFVALAFVSYLLFQQWQLDYNTPVQPATPVEQTTRFDNAVPSADLTQSTDAVPESTIPGSSVSSRQFITVKTDTLTVKIDTRGGDIVLAKLTQFPLQLPSETDEGSAEKITIFQQQGQYTYTAQSGLIGTHGPDSAAEGRPIYSVSANEFELGESDSLSVPLTFIGNNGVTVTKTFVFEKGSYNIGVQYQVANASNSNARMQLYGELQQSIQGLGDDSGMFMATYRGPAYSSSETRYEKYDFGDIEDKKLNVTTSAGWVAMLQHYFLSAWIPEQTATNQLYTRMLSNGVAAIGFKSPVKTIAANQTDTFSTSIYVGPKDQDSLKAIANNLDLTVDYGFLWWLSQPLFVFLQFLHSLVGNWGVAIILITLVVKGLLYPLTKAQYVSMAKMRKLQPKMTALKERFGDDRQKMSQAMMEMYKKEKVNPAGGCLPMLLQMPIFLALYWVFLESVELRQADFALWIHDLSVQDPYYVLPLLMGASMYLMQKMQPMTIQDPMQQKVMQFMPVMMTIFFLWFPSGLVLYWLVSNLITIAQMFFIFRGIEKKEQAAKA